MKNLTVNGQKLKIKVGRSFTRISFSNGKSTAVSHSALTGLSGYEVERGQRKRYFKVQPHDVIAYLLNGKPAHGKGKN